MSDRFLPPEPVGEPFHGDPSDPNPFLTEGETPAAPSALQPGSMPVPGHPPTHSSPEAIYPGSAPQPRQQAQQGQFRQPQSAPVDPVERFARTAVWVGVASIFIFNVIFGPIAVVMGAMAIQRGQKEKGWLAVGLGVLGTVIGIVVLVLVSTGVMPSWDEMIDDLRNR